MVEHTLSSLNQHLGTRKEAYNFASLVYYLPSFDSRCCTMQYLNSLVSDPCPYFKIEKTKIHPQNVSYRKYTAAFLLEHLDDYLFSSGFNPTGFTSLDPPNIQWLYEVILALEPNDPLGLLKGGPQSLAEQATMKIDPK